MTRWSAKIFLVLAVMLLGHGLAASAETGPIAVSFTGPSAGATLSGTAAITVAATGGSGYRYTLAVDDAVVYTGTNPTFNLDTVSIANGAHTLTATVTDASNRTGSGSMIVTVSNTVAAATAGFTASITYPAPGKTVSGGQSVGMATTATWGAPKTFVLSIDGAPIVTRSMATGSTLWIIWDTRTVANGARSLSLAVTANGQTATTTQTVTVANGTSSTPPTPPPPTPSLAASFTSPAAGASVTGSTTVGMTAAGTSGSTTFTLALGSTVLSSQTVTGTSASYAWNTAGAANGSHTLTLTVTNGAQTATATRTVTVSNVASPPTASFTAAFTYPNAGQAVSGSQSVGMSTTALWAAPKTFALSVDGAPIVSRAMTTGSTLWVSWDTKTVANGARTLTLAVTANGQTATTTRTVTVSNDTSGTPPPPPTALRASFTAPGSGSTVSGTALVSMAVTGATTPTTLKLTVCGATADLSNQTLSGTVATHDWVTSGVPDGTHTLTATVTDAAGKTATATRSVTVANTSAPPPAGGMGPLRVLASNPRYFTDGTGRAIYLTGSHHWENLLDRDIAYPPSAFDYTGYLNFLDARNHNFMRMWAWEPSRDYIRSEGTTSFTAPSPWMRTGPGTALDGRPKWDLSKLNQAYFDRLRARVQQAQARGIYVSVMLFEGWALQFATVVHPFDAANNVNGIDADVNNDGKLIEAHTLAVPAVTAIQEAYVRKVIDTVNDLDNVLYEIANESGPYSTAWQYAMIEFINQYQAGKPQQHPVGMTFQYTGGTDAALLSSPADWISPAATSYRTAPPATNGSKVVVADTDHLGGADSNLGRAWVWKSFTRGVHTIYMDRLDSNATREDARKAMGRALDFAHRMNLATMTPQPALCSTTYCLADASGPDAEVVVYLPSGGTTTVNLGAASGTFRVEWRNAATNAVVSGGTTTGGATRSFTAPFSGDAVLYIGNR
jgi:PKD repeat protein